MTFTYTPPSPQHVPKPALCTSTPWISRGSKSLSNRADLLADADESESRKMSRPRPKPSLVEAIRHDIHGVIRHERNYLFRNFQWHLRDMELSRQEKNSVKHFLGIFPRFSWRSVNEIINSEGRRKKTLFKKIWMIGVRLSDYPLCSKTGGSSLGFVSWTCSVSQNRIWLTQQKKTSIPRNPKKMSKPNFPNPSLTKNFHPFFLVNVTPP